MNQNFICRVCGHNIYRKLKGLDLFTCCSCSTIFEDGDDFSLPIVEFRITDEEIENEKRYGTKWKLPTRKYPTDSGMDIQSTITHIIPSYTSYLFKTGVAVKLPKRFEIEVRPRSGLSEFVIIPNSPGTIDETYRGEILVRLFNISNKPKIINRYDRIGQLVINHVVKPIIKENYENLDEFLNTDRSDNGFGSSGK